jgi:hypothetical protein
MSLYKDAAQQYSDYYISEYDTVTLNTTHIPSLTANSINSIGTSAGMNGTYSVGANGTSGSNWITTNSSQSSLNVKGDAEFEGKVKVNGQDLGEFMETISRRLAILVPDPEKLEHFEALKKAYNHYKTLEALCELPNESNE